ncbi:hypothetical protein M3Y94_00482900 [Aphelenchoides besseyi]|nr:hypothetical protein M3Y94_00482900 [Aphelenchoides besseyi]
MEELIDLIGPNVCEYRNPRLVTSTSTNGPIKEFVKRIGCCPGYESLDKRTCTSKMDFLNFSLSENFSLALICLALLFISIGVLSMVISYRFYYRYRIGRKSKGILTEEDLDCHEDNFVVGVAPRHMDDNPYKPIVCVRPNDR